MGQLEQRTATEMGKAVNTLKHVVLQHKTHTLDYSCLITVARMIQVNNIHVAIAEQLVSSIRAGMMYVSRNKGVPYFDGYGGFAGIAPGNTLYLRRLPGSSHNERATLAHEAVHAFYDMAGKSKNALANEEMAFFVEGYVFARLDPMRAKKRAKADNKYLIGCLAFDFFDAHKDKDIGVVISTKQFNKQISFDYTKEGGAKGRINPYEVLTTAVKKAYNYSRTQDYPFDGIGYRSK